MGWKWFALSCLIFPLLLAANSTNPPLAMTGGYGEPTCTQCHSGTVNPAGGSVSISGVLAVFSPGSTIPVRVQIKDAAASTWGFELSARFLNGAQAGSFGIGSGIGVGQASWLGFPVQYAYPSLSVTQSGSTFTFTVNWTAPVDVTGGEVVFDAIGVAGNGNGAISGDHTYTTESRAASKPPAVNDGGIVNAASYQPILSPGQLISIFGQSMTTGGPYAATTLPLPGSLGPTQVRMNFLDCPLIYVSATQINAQIPENFPPGPLTVYVNGLVSASQQVTMSDTAPAIFSQNAQGQGPGAILHADYSQVTATHPATPGEIVLIFATGLGITSVTHTTQAAVFVTMGGASASTSYAGLAPGFVGLYQVNATVPTNLKISGNVEILLTAGAVTSRSGVTVAVQ